MVDVTDSAWRRFAGGERFRRNAQGVSADGADVTDGAWRRFAGVEGFRRTA